tara:strand:+ start:216 stop:878 length:663 start_codon:yes stop_codon:yes gene_type:complete
MNLPYATWPGVSEALAAPFPPQLVKWRVGAGGKNLPYIDARDAMNRLDDVVLNHNWEAKFKEPDSQGRIICALSITVQGHTVTKMDAGKMTKVEGEKGGISDALKRAAVNFGIGRYLYAIDDASCRNQTLPAWAKPNFKCSMDWVKAYSEECFEIRQLINPPDGSMPDYFGACGIWDSLPEEAMFNLHRAPSKGGFFTREELEIIRSMEYRQSAREEDAA